MLSGIKPEEMKVENASQPNVDLIKESKQFSDILKLISFDTWVLLDLDNTVMESTQPLGSDQWFKKLLVACAQHIEDKILADEVAVLIYHLVEHFVITKAVEPSTKDTIKFLQDMGVPVLGITARDEVLMNTTFRQLDEAGIDLSKNHDNHTLLLGTDNTNNAVYHGGIIFCSGKNKGKCLDAFLEKCEFLPEHFIMVDDKHDHVKSVQESVTTKNKRFNGIHYTHLDDKVKKFDMKEANIQMSSIMHKLTEQLQKKIEETKKEQEKLHAAIKMVQHLSAAEKSNEVKHHEQLFEKDPLRPSKKRAYTSMSQRGRFFESVQEMEALEALDLAQPQQKKLKTGVSLKVDQPNKETTLRF